MSDLPSRPPRPAWADPSPPAPQPEGPPRPTRRQAKRWREKANKRLRIANTGVIDPAEEARVAKRVAAQFNNSPRPSPAAQHREAIEDHHQHRSNRWRYDEVGP